MPAAMRLSGVQKLESAIKSKPVYRLFFSSPEERPIDAIQLATFENGFSLFLLDSPLSFNPSVRMLLANSRGELRFQTLDTEGFAILGDNGE